MLLNVAYYDIMIVAAYNRYQKGGSPMFDYENYDKECEEIRASNSELLDMFINDRELAGLSAKTIRSHISNVDFCPTFSQNRCFK